MKNFITILLDSYRSIFIENSFIPLLFLIFLILTFVMYILSQNFRMKLIIEIRRSKLLIITFLSLCISILVGGRFYYHYIIQLFPFFSIFTLVIFSSLKKSKTISYIVLITIIIINFIPLANSSIKNLINYKTINESYVVKGFSDSIDASVTLH